jgi:hypothetical protein
MIQLEGFVIASQKNKVYHLKKALYGLRQALRAWYSNIDEYLKEKGLHHNSVDYNLYYCFEDG